MYKCDFCGKDQTKVNRIIVGPNGISICNKCVLVCTGALIDETLIEFKNENIEDIK